MTSILQLFTRLEYKMEKQPIDLSHISLASDHNLPTLKDSKLPPSIIKNKRSSNYKENVQKRKVVIEEKEKVKRMQLKKKLQEREMKMRMRLQQKEHILDNVHPTKQEEPLKLFDHKNIHSSISSNRLKRVSPLVIQDRSLFKENTFKLYSQTHTLPTLNRSKFLQMQIFQKKNNDINLTQFGIFTETKSNLAFLKRFRQNLEHQFIGGINIQSEEDLYRLQFCLLREIHSQGKWIQ